MELIRNNAPAVHARAKSRWNPSAVDASIKGALFGTRGYRGTMVAFHENEAVGLVTGDRLGDCSSFTEISHKQFMGFPTYAALDAAAKNGQQNKVYWFKGTSGWATNAWGDCWPVSGVPDAGAYTGTANTARQFDNTTTGGLWISTVVPESGQTRHFVEWSLSSIVATTGAPTLLILYDRVLTYEGTSITTTPTTFTNTLPATRYISSGQEGLQIFPTATAATGSTASTISALTFTDNNGNASVSIPSDYAPVWWTTVAAGSTTTPAAICAHRDTTASFQPFPWLTMPENVTGVRQLTSITSSATNTGTICWALAKPIGTMWCQASSTAAQGSPARFGFALEQVFDNACLSFLITSAATTTRTIEGWIRLVHA